MRRETRVLIALLALVGSIISAVMILASDVSIEADPTEVSACGSVYSVLAGDFVYGGEQVWPTDYEPACRAAAHDRATWEIAPGVVAALSTTYLGVVAVQAVRGSRAREKREASRIG